MEKLYDNGFNGISVKLNDKEKEIILFMMDNYESFNNDFDVFYDKYIFQIISRIKNPKISYIYDYLEYCFNHKNIKLKLKRNKIEKLKGSK